MASGAPSATTADDVGKRRNKAGGAPLRGRAKSGAASPSGGASPVRGKARSGGSVPKPAPPAIPVSLSRPSSKKYGNGVDSTDSQSFRRRGSGSSVTGRSDRSPHRDTASELVPRRKRTHFSSFATSNNDSDEDKAGGGEASVGLASISVTPDSVSQSPSQKKDKIKVCVRVRPLSESEERGGTTDIVNCISSTSLTIPNPAKAEKSGVERAPIQFNFDWVLDNRISQAEIYRLLGEGVVEGVADGFHGSVFAYGQTGSGKSHSIFGGLGDDDRGLVPRITEGLFHELQAKGDEYIVKLSYLELYNEKARDLLRPDSADGQAASSKSSLEVREHPHYGVFVEGLTSNVVQNSEQVSRLLKFGHRIRVVGCTNMNAHSSRSHAVVTLQVERTITNDGQRVKRRATLNAVDLAGSERHDNLEGTSNSESRMRESKNINKSLSALSLMISRLAMREAGGISPGSHIPYRNSKLTFLLSDSLMGNSRTAMLACVSPASGSVAMTESTLRFASSVKTIRTRPVQNDELDGDLIQNLYSEIENLRQLLNEANDDRRKDIQDQLATSLALHKQQNKSWAEQHHETQLIEDERNKALDVLGIDANDLISAWKHGEKIHVRSDADPYLVNVCDDPLLSGCLTYTLPRGETVSVGSDPSMTIQIDGLGVQPEMCFLKSIDEETVEVHIFNPCDKDEAMTQTLSGAMTPCFNGGMQERAFPGGRPRIDVNAPPAFPPIVQQDEVPSPARGRRGGRRGSLWKSGIAEVFVNSERVLQTQKMQHGDRLRVGRTHVFQVFIPQASQKESPVQAMANRLITRSTNQVILAQGYAEHLEGRIGVQRATKVFRSLQELQPLVEEANNLTEELRGGDHAELVFKAHVLTDVTSAAEDPELAVAIHGEVKREAAEVVAELRKALSDAQQELTDAADRLHEANVAFQVAVSEAEAARGSAEKKAPLVPESDVQLLEEMRSESEKKPSETSQVVLSCAAGILEAASHRLKQALALVEGRAKPDAVKKIFVQENVVHRIREISSEGALSLATVGSLRPAIESRLSAFGITQQRALRASASTAALLRWIHEALSLFEYEKPQSGFFPFGSVLNRLSMAQAALTHATKIEEAALDAVTRASAALEAKEKEGVESGCDRGRKARSVIAVWSVFKFKHRLEELRDVYEEVSGRSEPWGEADDRDPWKDERGSVPSPVSEDRWRRRSKGGSLSSGGAVSFVVLSNDAHDEDSLWKRDADPKLLSEMSNLQYMLAQALAEKDAALSQVEQLQADFKASRSRSEASATNLRFQQAEPDGEQDPSRIADASRIVDVQSQLDRCQDRVGGLETKVTQSQLVQCQTRLAGLEAKVAEAIPWPEMHRFDGIHQRARVGGQGSPPRPITPLISRSPEASPGRVGRFRPGPPRSLGNAAACRSLSPPTLPHRGHSAASPASPVVSVPVPPVASVAATQRASSSRASSETPPHPRGVRISRSPSTPCVRQAARSMLSGRSRSPGSPVYNCVTTMRTPLRVYAVTSPHAAHVATPVSAPSSRGCSAVHTPGHTSRDHRFTSPVRCSPNDRGGRIPSSPLSNVSTLVAAPAPVRRSRSSSRDGHTRSCSPDVATVPRDSPEVSLLSASPDDRERNSQLQNGEQPTIEEFRQGTRSWQRQMKSEMLRLRTEIASLNELCNDFEEL